MKNDALMYALLRLTSTKEIISICFSHDNGTEPQIAYKQSSSSLYPKGHSQNIPELCFALDGSFSLELIKNDINVHKDQLIFLLPGEYHRETVLQPDIAYDVLWIAFIAPKVLIHVKSYKKPDGYSLIEAMELFPDSKLFDCMTILMIEAKEHGLAWQEVCRGLICAIATYLVRAIQDFKNNSLYQQTVERSNTFRMEQAVRFIENYYDSNIQLEDVAGAIYLSSSYFSSLFKDTYGITFNEYLTNVRLIKACQLLCFSKMPLDEIACKVGYNSQSYLTRVFKKELGRTPSDYRKAFAEKAPKGAVDAQ